MLVPFRAGLGVGVGGVQGSADPVGGVRQQTRDVGRMHLDKARFVIEEPHYVGCGAEQRVRGVRGVREGEGEEQREIVRGRYFYREETGYLALGHRAVV